VVGRKRATREDFSGYSEAMKAKGGEWSFADLAGFVHSPKGWLPGTKMLFPGVAEPGDVADLLAYIRSLADSPAPLPN
jgi:cytochrome c